MALKGKAHSRHHHVFAVVRFDLPISSTEPNQSVSVVKVFASEQMAEQEASRLNGLNGQKGILYVVYLSHWMPSDGQPNDV